MQQPLPLPAPPPGGPVPALSRWLAAALWLLLALGAPLVAAAAAPETPAATPALAATPQQPAVALAAPAQRQALATATAYNTARAQPASGPAPAAASEQALNGLFVGASGGLILYGLALWLRGRDARVAWFTLTAVCSTAYYAAVSGLLALHGGGSGADWAGTNAPLFGLLAAGSACGLAHSTLPNPAAARRRALCWRSGGVLAGAASGLLVLGLLNAAAVQALATVLAAAPLLMALPTHPDRRRASDSRAGGATPVAWPVLALALVAALVGALPALLQADGLALHTAQSASLVALALGMAVLRGHAPTSGAARHGAASAAHAPRTTLDPAMPGLLNRQELQAATAPLLAQCSAQQTWAVFHVELDGYAAISHSLGSAAAGVLRAAAADRLQSHLRSTDLVCHLEGAAFALVVGPLSQAIESEARAIQNKLQKAFEQPFSTGHSQCCLGLKAGSALARGPQHTLDQLLLRAQSSTPGRKSSPPLDVQVGGTAIKSGI